MAFRASKVGAFKRWSLGATDLRAVEYQLQHHRDDRRREIVAVNVALILLASISVVLRLLARRLHKAPLKADDYVMIAAMVPAFGLCAAELLTVRYGLGRHAIMVGWPNLSNYLKGIFSYEILYITCIFTVKTSILLFYRRIFPVRAARIVIYSVLGFICVYTIAALNIIVFQCRPIRYFWDRASIPGMYFIILIIPLPLVWRLRIPRAQKLAVTGAFLLGGFVCIASVVRVTYVTESKLMDPTWTDVSSLIWSTVEPCVGIISANLPIMRSLFRKSGPPPRSEHGKISPKEISTTNSSPTSPRFPPSLCRDDDGYEGMNTILVHHHLATRQHRYQYYPQPPLRVVTGPERAVIAPWDEEMGFHGRTMM